jgi:hypothetical protein
MVLTTEQESILERGVRSRSMDARPAQSARFVSTVVLGVLHQDLPRISPEDARVFLG